MARTKRTPLSTADAGAGRPLPSLIACLVLVVFALAGCGGKRESLADCLNAKGFLVQGDATVVRGTSAAGVSFTLTVYPSPAAARRAHARKPKGTAQVGAAVVDFSGNPPSSPSGRPAQLSENALALIRSCLARP